MLRDEKDLAYIPDESVVKPDKADDMAPKEDAPADNGDGPDRLVQIVGVHDDVIADHDEKITWLLDQQKKDVSGDAVPWSWKHVAGQERLELWQHLVDFVDWLNRRYLSYNKKEQIVPCWYRHPEVVEELTGLWAAWWEATHDAETPNSLLARFHRDLLRPGLAEIKTRTDSCREARRHQSFGGMVRDNDPEMHDFIAEEVTTHDG